MINSKSLMDYDKPKTLAQLRNLQKNFAYVALMFGTVAVMMLWLSATASSTIMAVSLLLMAALFGAVTFVASVRSFTFGQISNEEADLLFKMAKKYPQVKKYIRHLNKKQNRHLTAHEVFMIKLAT